MRCSTAALRYGAGASTPLLRVIHEWLTGERLMQTDQAGFALKSRIALLVKTDHVAPPKKTKFVFLEIGHFSMNIAKCASQTFSSLRQTASVRTHDRSIELNAVSTSLGGARCLTRQLRTVRDLMRGRRTTTALSR
jgi:hypothetical protein